MLMLLKFPSAIAIGYLTVLSTLACYGVAAWQLSIRYAAFAAQAPAMQVGFWVGALLVFGIRVVILAAYIAALVIYGRWASRLSQAA